MVDNPPPPPAPASALQGTQCPVGGARLFPATSLLVSKAGTSKVQLELGHPLRTPKLGTKNKYCLPEQKAENINFERQDSKWLGIQSRPKETAPVQR